MTDGKKRIVPQILQQDDKKFTDAYKEMGPYKEVGAYKPIGPGKTTDPYKAIGPDKKMDPYKAIGPDKKTAEADKKLTGPYEEIGGQEESKDDRTLRDMLKLMRKPENGAKDQFYTPLSADQLKWLLEKVKPVFEKEKQLVETSAPISLCGDVHGQYADVLRIFAMYGWPWRTRYMFLGDYVDRGPHSIQTISLLFVLKIMYPKQIFLLRGNHETKPVNRTYGFWDEIKANFGKGDDKTFKEIFKSFNEVFDHMPLAGLVSGRILCMHGGLSPELTDLNQIRDMKKPLPEIPKTGLASDLLWADPDKDARGFVPGIRGVSYTFGADAVADKCNLLNLDLIARGHQVVNEGYEFFGAGQLITLFSAPDYCGQFTNSGGVLLVNEDLTCKVKQIPSKTLPPPSKR